MKKTTVMILVLLFVIAFCAIAESSDDNTTNEIYIGEPVIINCEDYIFSVAVTSIDDTMFNGYCIIKADVKNLSEKPVDYAQIHFQIINQDGDVLGDSHAFIAFVPEKLKSGRKMECDITISNVSQDEIYALEFTSCEVLKDNGASRSYVGRANLFYDDISIIVK